ncbi:PilW family protein [Pelagibaculum spongiae]|uniref:Pilus assembly protein PilW n=1 Tax=Pelagibaculum spongiae TaxID=2080658 RepID=A0A2V1H231_9GAMM|nr:PilW family protein [Pelagibaculum spongiae]PVZ70431.1 hypothetical protein DC094_07520 [Pelagibaculum spongiae]
MKIKITNIKGLAQFKGLTIVELLISLAISSLLMAGMVTMVASNAAVFRDNETSAEAGENLRYSLDVLSRNITMAGFMGNTQPSNVSATTDLTNKTAALFADRTKDNSKYADPANFNNFVWYGNLKSTGLSDFSSKDINGLVVKQALSGGLSLDKDEITTPHALYILANPFTAQVYSSGAAAKPTDSAENRTSGDTTSPLVMPVGSDIPGGRLYQYQTFIYTIENDANTNTPSLIQYSLKPVASGSGTAATLTGFTFTAETLVENVTEFEFKFGVDTDGDSVLDEYKESGNMVVAATADASAIDYWNDVRSMVVKVKANVSDATNAVSNSLGTTVVLRNLAIQQGAG